MKKLALLLAGVVIGHVASAQLILSGTSYTQNFDNVAAGLPIGWEVDSFATATSKGFSINFDTTRSAWNGTSGKYKNYAAKGSFTTFAGTTAAMQNAATNRALGLRQVGAIDSGAAFILQIANTTGLTNFNLSFKLMSLDSSSPRVTTWRVDYGFGATPSSFTSATATGTLTTGGYTFAENTISANFGAALDNQAGPVWIRIAAIGKTTGSGNRATTAIDDFNLSWTGSGSTIYNPQVVSKAPTGANVPLGTNLSVTFDRVVQKGTGNFYVKNETDQTMQTVNVTSSNVTVASNVATVTGVTLALGKTYHVTFDSTAFDTAGYKSYAITDTTAWVFSTPVPPPPPVTTLNENFETSCGATPAGLPAAWAKYSVVGAQQWNCYTITAGSSYCLQMNGYQGGNNANEDWLLTPQLDLSAMSSPQLSFDHWKRFSGDELTVWVSNNYIGSGNPNNATWTNLNIAFNAADTGVWKTFNADLTAYKAQPFYIAFKYLSTTTNGYQSRLDNVSATNVNGINNFSKASLSFAVLGRATNNEITLGYNLTAGKYTLAVYDLTGREVYTQPLNVQAGAQRTTISGLNLTTGMYVIKLSNGNAFGVAKAIVE